MVAETCGELAFVDSSKQSIEVSRVDHGNGDSGNAGNALFCMLMQNELVTIFDF